MIEYLVNITFMRHNSYKKGECSIAIGYNRYWNEWGFYKRISLIRATEPFIVNFPFNQ